jgi:putative ATP-dependent endonuclease of OLD family
MEDAKKEVEAWQGCGMAKVDVALRVFEPLHMRNVSKAETAEQLAFIIDSVTGDAAAFRARLPIYLVEAIEYVTRPLAVETKAEEPPP